jgi:Helix-turn-helix domain
MSNNEDLINGKLSPYEWQRAILASDLPSTTKLVLMALSMHLNKGTGLAFPSIRMLMKDTGLSNKAVIKHLRGAERAGWIETGNYGYFDQNSIEPRPLRLVRRSS